MRALSRAKAEPRVRPPEWLTGFTLADWYDPQEPVPLVEQVELGEVPWRCLQAHARWRTAGRDWLAESGYDDSPAGWRRVADASDWCADPRGLAKRVPHAGFGGAVS